MNLIMYISIVIPAFNEEDTVGKVVKSVPIEKLNKMGFKTEIIVVDNASTDKTAEEAGKAGANVIFEDKLGYGNAYLRGFKEAKGDIIIMGDADGTYPLENIYEFIQPILNKKADLVMCSRLRGEIQKGAMPLIHRYIGNPFLTWLLNSLFATEISDAHCGMRALTTDALNKLNLQSGGMEFASEMMIEAARKNLKIEEFPIEYRRRGGGEAKLKSLTDGWRHLRFMMLYRPMPFLMGPGLVILFLGIILTAEVWFQVQFRMNSLILGILLLLIGYQMFLTGLYFGAFGEVYGIYSSSISKKIMNYHSLEIELLIGFILLVSGIALGLNVLHSWSLSGSGEFLVQISILAMMLSILGFQTIFSSMFLSLLLLKKGE
jgi:glycosyltransferase involved in cell wall biosynthesis